MQCHSGGMRRNDAASRGSCPSIGRLSLATSRVKREISAGASRNGTTRPICSLVSTTETPVATSPHRPPTAGAKCSRVIFVVRIQHALHGIGDAYLVVNGE
jgi:hypothetical protein